MANVDQIDQFSSKYKVRRNQQMFRFFGSTLITLASCRLAIRGIKLKKYTPNMFQLNYLVPKTVYKTEASNAFVFATGITLGLFSMVITGSCWLWDISSLKEFKEIKGISESNFEKLNSNYKPLTNLPLDTPEMVNVYKELGLQQKK